MLSMAAIASRRKKSSGCLVAASYSRYSTSLQRCESTAEQKYACCEQAYKNNHHPPSELEFSDEAVSGTILEREGFQKMLAAARAGKFQVLYLYNLSRLARESVIGMPTLKDLVYNYHVRVISVTEGLDTDREGWEMLATLYCLQNEQFIKTLKADVRRGQEHNRRNEFSNGDYCLGYTSIVAPGEKHQANNKKHKPHMVIIIDEETKWIPEKVFQWFVNEHKSIQWIVQELNRLEAPKDHRSTNPQWIRSNVLTILRNLKYVGIWTWGVTKVVQNPLTGTKRQEPRPIEESEEFTWNRIDLAMIDPTVFAQAQEMLKKNAEAVASSRASNGTLNGSSKAGFGRKGQHLLQGLMLCPSCKKPFYSGGSNRRYNMFCINGRNGTCNNSSQLDRDLAEELILTEIAKVLIEDPEVHEKILQETMTAWEEITRSAPEDSKRIESEIDKLKSKISRLLDMIEEGEDSEIRKRLNERKGQLRTLYAQREKLNKPIPVRSQLPDLEWVKEQLKDLVAVLSGDPQAANHQLHQLIPDKIHLSLVSHSEEERPYYRGTFQLRFDLLATDNTSDSSPNKTCVHDDEIDFVKSNETKDAEVREARRLYDEGLRGVDIAESLGCCRAKVTNLLDASFAAAGEQRVDGRKRRWTSPQDPQDLPIYKKIADQAVAEWNNWKSLCEIGRICDCDAITAQKAINYWYSSQNLPVPTTATRREERKKLAFEMHQMHIPLKKIMKELNLSSTKIRAWLKEICKVKGVPMLDGRSKEFRSGKKSQMIHNRLLSK